MTNVALEENMDDTNITDPQAPEHQVAWPELTMREAEVAAGLVAGKRNSQIADDLGISVKTVDTHRLHVLKKLQCANNVALVHVAYSRGYVML